MLPGAGHTQGTVRVQLRTQRATRGNSRELAPALPSTWAGPVGTCPLCQVPKAGSRGAPRAEATQQPSGSGQASPTGSGLTWPPATCVKSRKMTRKARALPESYHKHTDLPAHPAGPSAGPQPAAAAMRRNTQADGQQACRNQAQTHRLSSPAPQMSLQAGSPSQAPAHLPTTHPFHPLQAWPPGSL